MRKMLKRGMAIALSLSVAMSGLIVVEPRASVVEAAEKYELVWSDEFEGDSLNRNNWNVEVNGYGGWNDELQYYCDSPENIAVSDGTLKITALKKTYEDKEYTSARLNTQGKVSVHFGKIEARMKLPSFKGAWPAFWMLGANGKMWPACGEIDILETVNDESIVYGTAHWENPNSGNAENYESSGSSTLAANAQIDITQWHTYGIEWDADKIVWYVDDIKYFVLDIASDPNRASLALEQYIILNLAVGGEWPGFSIDDTALPATMEVDYVRAYKLNENVTTTTEKKDALDTYQGTWSSTIGSWAGAAGTVTPMNPIKNGFVANISAVGTDEWGVQTSLPSIEYVAGNSYTFRCTLTSDIDKNVFVKVEGDNNAELAADYISLKANEPYNYETTVFIANTYTGNVSLFFAYGGGVNGETIASDSALNLTVKDVEFYTEVEVITEEPTTEAPTTEEPTTEEPTTEVPTTEAPTTEEPATEEPTTEAPTTEEPTTEEPTTEVPTTEDTVTEKNDSVETYEGTWNSLIGSWAGAAGTITPMDPVKDGFVANITAVGNNEWGVQTSLPSIEYVAGNSYTFRCTLTADIDKTVFVKVEGDNNAELAAEYISLKANEPYLYEKMVEIPSTYEGAVSLFFAYGGGANGEMIASDATLNLTVKDVEFYTGIGTDVEEVTTEETTTEEKTEEETEANKTEETSTETKTEAVTEENKTEETSTETKTEAVTEANKTEEASTETKTEENKTEETSTETKTEENKTEETSTESEAEDVTTENKTEESNTETKTETVTEENKTEVVTTEENKTEETTTEEKKTDTSVENQQPTTQTPDSSNTQNGSGQSNDVSNNDSSNTSNSNQNAEQQNVKKPGKTKVNKVNRISKNKKVKLVLKKVKDADGYQIKYSLSKKFAKKKTKTLHSKKNKVTLKKLNPNKKYYVKVRTYKIVDGEKIYSAWSTKKVIKIKK